MTGVLSRLKEGAWPYEIEGVQGGLHGFFLAEYLASDKGPLVIVVPTEKEIESLAQDLDLAGTDYDILPWWGTMAYRPVARGAVVFGQRSARLASLCMPAATPGAAAPKKVLIMTQRAFLSPVPPKEYFAGLLARVRKGDRFDSGSLAERLSGYGYTRVPRVTVHGEFALRGEVFDIFMPGETSAHRVVFEFDTVDEIKSFDPGDQTSLERLDELVIYPAKEVIWDGERIDALERRLASVPEFSSGGKALIEHLRERGTAEGEELFFPVAFEKSASVLDYLAGSAQAGGATGAGDAAPATVFFLDDARQGKAQESLEREYRGL
mgnify:CR=1 FL=1